MTFGHEATGHRFIGLRRHDGEDFSLSLPSPQHWGEGEKIGGLQAGTARLQTPYKRSEV